MIKTKSLKIKKPMALFAVVIAIASIAALILCFAALLVAVVGVAIAPYAFVFKNVIAASLSAFLGAVFLCLLVSVLK